jgi:hypothetical protein
MVEAILCASSSIWFDTEMVCCFSVIEVFCQNSIFDEALFPCIKSFIIDWVRTIASTEGWIIDHGYNAVPNGLSEFAVQTRVSCCNQIRFARMTKRFMDVNASEVTVGNKREFS